MFHHTYSQRILVYIIQVANKYASYIMFWILLYTLLQLIYLSI